MREVKPIITKLTNLGKNFNIGKMCVGKTAFRKNCFGKNS